MLNSGQPNKNETVLPESTTPAPIQSTVTSTLKTPSNKDISRNNIPKTGKVFMDEGKGYRKGNLSHYKSKIGGKKFAEPDSYFGDIPLPPPDDGDVPDVLPSL